MKKILLKALNPLITCPLCGGYFVDATTIVDCLHTYCRGCILKHFETARSGCPTCQKRKTVIRADHQIQALVYKMVPSLYSKEMQRREDFYRSPCVRASSSCSDDSVLGELRQDHEQWLTNKESGEFFSPDDSISLSLEYYQHHLDDTSTEKSTKAAAVRAIGDKSDAASDNPDKCSETDSKCGKKDDERVVRDRRYLQCPAAVSMSHLQKFLRMKFALSPEHNVDIIYEGEVLPAHYNLMDVAYSFNWCKTKPMRFFYRIFTPMKIQPIKIINTTSSSGSKQLQIVPVKPNPDTRSPSDSSQPSRRKSEVQETLRDAMKSDTAKKVCAPSSSATDTVSDIIQESQMDENKERLMAHLKLQSRHKAGDGSRTEPNCVFEYDEPDKDEIQKFAEKRDREWASMKHEDVETHHVSKKRKKNKHSKDVTHKKRKIHAEITSEVKQESIKLKVKLTPHNGHKHKHRLPQIVDPPKQPEVSSKEKLMEMRSVRKPSEPKVEVVSAPEEQKTKPKEESKQSTEKLTFLKTFQSDPERTNKAGEKVATTKNEKIVEKKPLNTYSKPNNLNQQNQLKCLEKQIASLQQQQCPEKKSAYDKPPHILNSQYPSGFTVSKIETGSVKRKAESDETKDKRPSLEITLINPPVVPAPSEPKAKRPPPATIPLERIKKSINNKSGVTIIPKTPEKCDNIGALDLSKPHRLFEIASKSNGITTLNGITDLKTLTSLSKANEKNTLSNLQMLSKVASELKSPANKARPQLPQLQTIKITAPQNKQPPNLAKLPKLNEIDKTQLRLISNTQIRSMRPAQNQTVRSIPNPSLLVRQQNQNRMLNLQNGDAKEQQPKILNSMAPKPEEKKKQLENGLAMTSS